MSRSQVVYSITVLNWHEHNKGHKKSFKKTQISNNFCSDARLRALPLSARWLFLALLLSCGDINNDTVTFTQRQLNDHVTTRLGAANVLDQLQSFQLVTYEIIENPLFKGDGNGMGRKGDGKKRGYRIPPTAKAEPVQETMTLVPEESDHPKKPKPEHTGTNEVIAAYCEAWKARYKLQSSPHIAPQHAKQLKHYVGQLGKPKMIEMIQAYLRMPDSWFVTKRHDVGTFLGNMNAVTQFLETGRVITKKEIQNLDQAVNYDNLHAMVDKGAI